MHPLPQKEFSRKVIALAYPVVLGMIARTVMNLVDAAMVGRLGAAQLAATGLGAHIVLVVTYSYGSIHVGVQALTARRFGQGKFDLCGRLINRTVIMILGLGIVGSVIGFFSGPFLLSLLADDPVVYRLGSSYVSIRLLEVFAFGVIGIYRGFFDGIGKTKINMQSMVVMNAVNIVLNYVLIFGKFGFPRLEVTGAAIASMISCYIGAGVMIFHSVLPHYREKYKIYKNILPDLELLRRLFKLSLPVMFQEFFVFTGFLLFMKILSMIGTFELAAGNVCIAIMSVSFMPGYGIGVAAATLVGQNLGARRSDMAEKYGWEAVKLGVILMGTIGIAFITFPGSIMRIFTPDTHIIQEGIIALRILGFVQFFDAFGMIFNNCLRSAGMTRYVMAVDVTINWGIFLPAAYLLGITFGMGTAGAWTSLALYVVLFGTIMGATFVKGSWKSIAI